ncbi:MAG TPA: hypothetical protein VFB84_18250 [Micromonosporaceae bacterium]|nr:hypothetical protein [Micromonosporaceae bacterium]
MGSFELPPGMDLNEVVEVDELSVATIEIEDAGRRVCHPVLDVTGVHSITSQPFRRSLVLNKACLAWLATSVVLVGRQLYGPRFDEALAQYEGPTAGESE